jgi:hypothetical protein
MLLESKFKQADVSVAWQIEGIVEFVAESRCHVKFDTSMWNTMLELSCQTVEL